MSSGVESSRQQPDRHGRHRRDRGGDTDTAWTPAVPTQAGPGRHGPTGQSGGPAERFTGALPTGAAPSEDHLRPVHGELPIPEPTTPPDAPAPVSANRPQPRRTRVSLSPEPATKAPIRRIRAEGATEPPADGLSMFDLGSIPASVTPPKSWRKAAWFATASSGGAMALLLAGSFLLAQHPSQPQAEQGWAYLERRGGQPLLEHEEFIRPPNPGRDGRTGPGDSSDSPSGTSTPTTGADSKARAGAALRSAVSEYPGLGGQGTRQSAPGAPQPTQTTRTTQPPQKPPSKPASVTVENEQPALYAASRDPQTMATRSQKYLDTVTEDAAQAHEMTTGELHQQGADGLRRKYAGIAYFEVRTIKVNQGDGYTVNSVKTVYNDGTSTTQRRTITFGDDGYQIASETRGSNGAS